MIKKTTLQKNISFFSTTQVALANKINMPEITQQYISAITRGKKSLSIKQVREVEKKLSIPAGWLDRYDFDSKTYLKLFKYRKLDTEAQLLFDDLSLHMINLEKQSEKN
ncbi:helix-turn-helix transcriptional regulator [Halovibrio sp. HP20-50]|uniref:helix-turn-helix transcriptional regulator n=1 Tax=Halovibrio sp. HP20-59 TaxID=3080275 RepID=UPI00294B14EF|nr:helix-turn-helix transcriptional regulator [Halovibrio sp. HP20-59]MEA2117931.1 helix-turn-helix transcriptional regulator [Halovibrio sp. HP20-59]